MKCLEIAFWVLMFIVFYTYVGYGIVLYVMVKVKDVFVKRTTLTLPSDLPDVTLMVVAFNEEDVVQGKMANCLALDYPADKLHICWVTDGSTDRTNDILAERYPQVTVMFDPPRRGKTAAMNRAVPLVSTPIVIFCDANTMLNRECIKEIVTLFTDPKVGCVAGEKRVAATSEDGTAATGEGLYWKYESTLKSLDSRLYSAVGAAGELFAIRRELFERMPDDTLLDDFVMSLRIAQKGYKIAYCDRAYATESGSADMKEEQKRKVRISAGGLQSISRLTPLLNPFKYGVLTFEYISHRVLRWTLTPVAMVLLLPLNIFLVIQTPDSILYIVMLVLQLLFYAAGFAGHYQAMRGKKSKLFIIPYYFLFMNINVFKGVAYLRKKRGTGAWEKAKRA